MGNVIVLALVAGVLYYGYKRGVFDKLLARFKK